MARLLGRVAMLVGLTLAGMARAEGRGTIALTTDERTGGFDVELQSYWGSQHCERLVTSREPCNLRLEPGPVRLLVRGDDSLDRELELPDGVEELRLRRDPRIATKVAGLLESGLGLLGAGALAAGLRGGAPCRDAACTVFLVDGGFVLTLLGLGFGIPTTLLGFTLAGPAVEIGARPR